MLAPKTRKSACGISTAHSVLEYAARLQRKNGIALAKTALQFGEIAIAENALSKLGANAELNPSNADACHLLAQIAEQTGQPSAIALDRERPHRAVPDKEQSFSEQRAGGWRRRVR